MDNYYIETLGGHIAAGYFKTKQEAEEYIQVIVQVFLNEHNEIVSPDDYVVRRRA